MKTSDTLLGELREFKRATLSRLEKIEKDVGSFRDFKFKLIGAAAAAAFIATTLATALGEIIRK